MTTLACRKQSRRKSVRASREFTGLDYLEVSEDHLRLKVYLLGALPSTPLAKDHFKLVGGRRIRGIQILSVQSHRFDDAELDDFVEITVDRFGDFSTYTLRVAHPAFDTAYDRLDFTFTAGCPTPLDCPSDTECPPARVQPTAINYLAKDYASFRQLIFDRLAVTLPDWRNRYVPDIGVTLVELLAYTADYLSYYQDAVATEAYLDTARQRVSVRRHARLVDYALHEGCNARALVVVSTTDTLVVDPEKGEFCFSTAPAPNLPAELTATQVDRITTSSQLIFEAIAPATLYAGHQLIHFYTWGDSECCLPLGSTAATLVDEWQGEGPNQTRKLKVQVGDILIFEELIGPKTGSAADRDQAHRCAVRLTRADRDIDPLTQQPIVHLEWSREDRLTFSLCLSALGPPPNCALIENVSVARGNVVIVDHGQSFGEELPPPKVLTSQPTCDDQNSPSEVTSRVGRFRPRLSRAGLAFSEPLDLHQPASRLFAQDPHRAVPLINLSRKWKPASDLIRSRSFDKHFVVEMDNERVAWLRFGDGTHGAQPPLNRSLVANYRIGGGREGNVGAEAISQIVWKTSVSSVVTEVRNPLPARGGVSPQTIQEAKLFAPHAFRRRLQRAITAEDYAKIAQCEFPDEVQRAAAQLRWNGSWYEALVAIDAFGSDQASQDLLARIKRRLRNYRRIGHDLRVQAAERVPVRIELDLCIRAVYLRAHVLADLQTRFSEFFHPDNLSFGAALYLSRVVSVAQSVPGVESVVVRTFERMFEGPRGEIAAGFISFGPFEIAICDNDPSFPENGQIQFRIGGGR